MEQKHEVDHNVNPQNVLTHEQTAAEPGLRINQVLTESTARRQADKSNSSQLCKQVKVIIGFGIFPLTQLIVGSSGGCWGEGGGQASLTY